ncbi:MAG: 2-phospho-L-lactate transferase [Chloroflexota bacterium]
MKVVALAGGVGGAKLADGLARCLEAHDLTIVVNTGDDFDHFGLRICPDLDTVCYTLAGLANPLTGWGREAETWNALEELKRLGAPSWFQLGDRDLATHLERTRRLQQGETLSEITQDFCRRWGVAPLVLPMSDEAVRTIVLTDEGELPFQEYFVRYRFRPAVRDFHFTGAETAHAAKGVLKAIESADVVVLCPSNPFVSIDPILAVNGVREAVMKRHFIAVSPIVAGEALKGPAAKMFHELGIPPSPSAVARHYLGFLRGMVLDVLDAEYAPEIERMGVRSFVTQTVMKSTEDRRQLAESILQAVKDGVL